MHSFKYLHASLVQVIECTKYFVIINNFPARTLHNEQHSSKENFSRLINNVLPMFNLKLVVSVTIQKVISVIHVSIMIDATAIYMNRHL